jgi:LCP family protein required for cell wall assembly
MVVASIEVATGRVALLSLPRNMIHTPLPEPLRSRFDCGCWKDLLNALYKYGEENPDLFPGAARPGMEALRGAVSELLALPIHHYVMVDMGGFVDVVDALGGVAIDVRDPVVVELSPPRPGDPWRRYQILPGYQTLDGLHALAYARSREGGSDYDRMYRQRCLLSAMATQAATGSLLLRLPELAAVAAERVTSDIPRHVLGDLARLATGIDTGSIVTVGFVPPTYAAWRDASGRPAPDLELIRQVAANPFGGPDSVVGPEVAHGGCAGGD